MSLMLHWRYMEQLRTNISANLIYFKPSAIWHISVYSQFFLLVQLPKFKTLSVEELNLELYWIHFYQYDTHKNLISMMRRIYKKKKKQWKNYSTNHDFLITSFQACFFTRKSSTILSFVKTKKSICLTS